MSKVGRVVAATVTTIGLAVAGTGCTDSVIGNGGPRPGVAAETDADVLRVEQVDDVVEQYCILWNDYDQAQPIAKSTIKGVLVQTWIQAQAATDLAEEAGVATPTLSDAELEEVWAQLGPIDDDNREPLGLLAEMQNALAEPLTEVVARDLADEVDGQPTQEQTNERAVQLLSDWIKEHDVVINPAFGTIEDGEVVLGGDALSVPVSALADAAAAEEPSTDYLAQLPAAQRCGPASAPEPEAPLG